MAKLTSFERDLSQLATKLSDAELRVGTLRSQLDARLAYWHEEGVPLRQLALASGLSRTAVYKALNRHRTH